MNQKELEKIVLELQKTVKSQAKEIKRLKKVKTIIKVAKLAVVEKKRLRILEIERLVPEVTQMRNEGITWREIGKHFHYSPKAIKEAGLKRFKQKKYIDLWLGKGKNLKQRRAIVKERLGANVKKETGGEKPWHYESYFATHNDS